MIFEQKLIFLLKIIIGLINTTIENLTDCTWKIFSDLRERDHDANGQWISFLFESSSYQELENFVFVVTYGEVIPFIIVRNLPNSKKPQMCMRLIAKALEIRIIITDIVELTNSKRLCKKIEKTFSSMLQIWIPTNNQV